MMAATWWLPPGFERYEYVCVRCAAHCAAGKGLAALSRGNVKLRAKFKRVPQIERVDATVVNLVVVKRRLAGKVGQGRIASSISTTMAGFSSGASSGSCTSCSRCGSGCSCGPAEEASGCACAAAAGPPSDAGASAPDGLPGGRCTRLRPALLRRGQGLGGDGVGARRRELHRLFQVGKLHRSLPVLPQRGRRRRPGLCQTVRGPAGLGLLRRALLLKGGDFLDFFQMAAVKAHKLAAKLRDLPADGDQLVACPECCAAPPPPPGRP